MIQRKFIVTAIALGTAGGLAYQQHANMDARAATVAAPEASTPPGAAYKSAVPAEQRRVFFGELHLHTALSFDAWTSGTKLMPEDAYRFGRGDTVMVPASQVASEQGLDPKGMVAARRAWPLDFMAVTDHSEEIGVLQQLDQPGNAFAQTATGKKILANPPAVMLMRVESRLLGKPLDPALEDPKVSAEAWELVKQAANANYRPGKFTTFIAYEWSAEATGRNLHRNVIFNSDHAPAPFTGADSNRPEDLWSYLERARASGIDVLAIPHNGNASGGLMYDWNDSNGRPIDEAYAQRRATNEPLTEIVQTKGQSETMPLLSPNDEFANFEVYDHLLGRVNAKSEPNGSYIRQAYGRGLVIQAKVGANPYKYGLVGGSDIHNALTTTDESATTGRSFGIDPATMMPAGDAAKREIGMLPQKPRPVIQVPGAAGGHEGQGKPPAPDFTSEIERSSAGLTGVWAEENTRNSIFAALKRKETFATSGTRMRVRVFGGWQLGPELLHKADWVARAYHTGVPMGADLPAKPDTASAPGFLIQAMKDPTGANLDRVQVIKITEDKGDYKEKIFDVALSDGRRVDPATGKAPEVGNTVDLKTGKTANGIGAATFTTYWRDPEFDAGHAAVYYVRVLEIPTARWSTLMAIKNNLPISSLRPATIQERAWASPIWYTPLKAHM
ncbi:DUF3604 domain-containing protein [Telluria sp. Tellsp104]